MSTVNCHPFDKLRMTLSLSKGQLSTVRQSLPGFTLIELLLVMAIFAIIFSFTTINFLKPQKKASVAATAQTLVADIRHQQTKAMASDSQGSANTQDHGIFFESNRYTLFQGPTYLAGEPSNFAVDLGSNLAIANNLPSSQIVFSKNNGLWPNFNDNNKTIIVRSYQAGDPLPAPPPTGATCQDADINNDGTVDVPNDIIPIALNQPPNPYKPIYDVNKDGLVNLTDANIAISFLGQICQPEPSIDQKIITVNRYGGIFIN